jgi:hypothetical protein
MNKEKSMYWNVKYVSTSRHSYACSADSKEKA